MSREELQVNFRMPASLKRELEMLAKENRRSLTAEIVARLEQSVVGKDAETASDTISEAPPEHRGLRIPRTRGVNKDVLLKSAEKAEGESAITRSELFSAVDEAIEHALGRLGLGGAPESNTGPKPRTRYLKK